MDDRRKQEVTISVMEHCLQLDLTCDSEVSMSVDLAEHAIREINSPKEMLELCAEVCSSSVDIMDRGDSEEKVSWADVSSTLYIFAVVAAANYYEQRQSPSQSGGDD